MSMVQRLQQGSWGLMIFLGLGVLGRSLVDPRIGQPAPMAFPAIIPLAGLELISQEPLQDPEATRKATKALYRVSHRYSYRDDGQGRPTVIAVRYLFRNDGNVPALINDIAKLPISEADITQATQEDPILGHYTYFRHQGQSYLSACVNPRGRTTVTGTQFEDNLSAEALRPSVIAAWLLQGNDLRDRRCLWTVISQPTDLAQSQKQQQQLLKILRQWEEWWQQNYPPT
ncbi:MAG: cyanoexosortase A system-associated protein [Oscillatoriales cyanobacterium SM2_2_1]|nr:cyanoexosortase A system-associated protein [Oscillatoriales cyanobacterium SM2_2_1]